MVSPNDSVLPTLQFTANLTFLFNEIESFSDKYAAAKAAGFNAVEWGNNVYDYPINDLVKATEEHNLQHALINMFTGKSKGLACVPGRSEEFKQCLELSIAYCKNLNCSRMHIMAGQYGIDEENLTEELKQSYHQTYLDNLKFASERLEFENITILIEPISTIENYFLTTAEQAVDVIKILDRTNIKLQLDLYHQQRTLGNLTETITKYLPSIGHIQISQVPNRGEPNDEGEINYKYIFKLLQKLGYREWIGCEYTPALVPYETFDWMKPYMRLPNEQGLTDLKEMMQKVGL